MEALNDNKKFDFTFRGVDVSVHINRLDCF